MDLDPIEVTDVEGIPLLDGEALTPESISAWLLSGVKVFTIIRNGPRISLRPTTVRSGDIPYLEPLTKSRAEGQFLIGFTLEGDWRRFTFPCDHGRLRQLASWCRTAHTKSMAGADKRGIAHSLSLDDIFVAMNRSEGRCEVSGIEFDFDGPGEFTRNPFAPSIDRINSAGVYEARNCRIVCGAVNAALNEWGDAVFERVVEACASRVWLGGQSATSEPLWADLPRIRRPRQVKEQS